MDEVQFCVDMLSVIFIIVFLKLASGQLCSYHLFPLYPLSPQFSVLVKNFMTSGCHREFCTPAHQIVEELLYLASC